MTEGQNLVPALLWRMRKVEEMRACEAWADVDVGLHQDPVPGGKQVRK